MKISTNNINFRTLLVALVLALLPNLDTTACVSERPTHNYYLFSVFHRSLMGNRFETETNVFWKKYVNNNPDFSTYQWSRELVMDVAKSKKDTEMLAYLRLLNAYLDASISFNTWNYPSKAKIAKRRSTMQSLLATARNYKGSRLRAQYMLMVMRTQFALEQYQETSDYWTNHARKLPQSVYRDMMQNLYAGCLLRLGHRREAVEIYATQEDFRSLQYCVRNYRNLAGISKVYAENPNSPTLLYLVQDFVNNLQETQDVFANEWSLQGVYPEDSDKVNWMKEIGARPIYKAEARQFIEFARKVVAEGKSRTPCLWMSAIGCLEHQMGDYQQAKTDLAKALTLDGTPRMKDNARAIYAANLVFVEPMKKKYRKWMTAELQWLDAKSAQDVADSVLTDDHYHDVKERIVYNGLVPRYFQSGDRMMAMAMLNMMDGEFKRIIGILDWRHPDPKGTYRPWNADYWGEYFEALDTISVKQLKDYARFLIKKPKDALQRYVWGKCYRDADYYNDFIGTKLMAQGKFSEAIPYLEKVSIRFLNTQNIAPYARQRSYGMERWQTKQKLKGGLDDFAPSLTTNKKLDFCRHILAVQQLYQNMRPSDQRRQKAYELASLYYQASYLGDCWWLTQYGVSMAQDSAKAGDMDFVAHAIGLLEESAQSANFSLRQKSLYALAFIPRDSWYKQGWDGVLGVYYDRNHLVARPASRQYRAMMQLSEFARENDGQLAPYISRCEELKAFERVRLTSQPLAWHRVLDVLRVE
jgi:tetratricopeptide (TPR) repeat protein